MNSQEACSRFVIVYANRQGQRFVESVPSLTAAAAVATVIRYQKNTLKEPYEIIRVVEWPRKEVEEK